MKTFTKINDLVAHYESVVEDVMFDGGALMDEIKLLMSRSVETHVYDVYEPKEYVRREQNGGLSSFDNIQLTGFDKLTTGRLLFTIANITQGGDSLKGHLLTPTIVEGIKENWYKPDGIWSEPRDFMTPFIGLLKENEANLTNLLKRDLRAKGLKVK